VLGLGKSASVIRDGLEAIPAAASMQRITGLISPRILPKAGPRVFTRLEAVLAEMRGNKLEEKEMAERAPLRTGLNGGGAQ